MSTWLSEQQASNTDASGESLGVVTNIYTDVVTDADGQFEVDLTLFDLVEVIEASAMLVGQTLSAVDNITDKLIAMVVEVTNTAVKGVVIKPTETNVAVLGTTVDSVVRGGAGNNVKVKVTGRK